jgi:hypothetical protein
VRRLLSLNVVVLSSCSFIKRKPFFTPTDKDYATMQQAVPLAGQANVQRLRDLKKWFLRLAMDDLLDAEPSTGRPRWQQSEAPRVYAVRTDGEAGSPAFDLLPIKGLLDEYNARCPILIWTYTGDADFPIFASVRRLVYRRRDVAGSNETYNYLIPEIEYPIGSCCVYKMHELNARLGLDRKETLSGKPITKNSALGIWFYHPENIVCSGMDQNLPPAVPLQWFLDPLRLGPFLRWLNGNVYALSPFKTATPDMLALFPRQHPDLALLYDKCRGYSEALRARIPAPSPPAAAQRLQREVTIDNARQRFNAANSNATRPVRVPPQYFFYDASVYVPRALGGSAGPLVESQRRDLFSSLENADAYADQKPCSLIDKPFLLRVYVRRESDTTSAVESTVFDTNGEGAYVVTAGAATPDSEDLGVLVPLVSKHAGTFTRNVDLSYKQGADLPCVTAEEVFETQEGGATEGPKRMYIKYTLEKCPHHGPKSAESSETRFGLTPPVIYISPYTPEEALKCEQATTRPIQVRVTQTRRSTTVAPSTT